MPSGQGLTADRPRGIASEGLRVLAIDEHLDEKCLREAKIAGEARSAAPLRVCDRVTAAQRASKRKRGPKTPRFLLRPAVGTHIGQRVQQNETLTARRRRRFPSAPRALAPPSVSPRKTEYCRRRAARSSCAAVGAREEPPAGGGKTVGNRPDTGRSRFDAQSQAPARRSPNDGRGDTGPVSRSAQGLTMVQVAAASLAAAMGPGHGLRNRIAPCENPAPDLFQYHLAHYKRSRFSQGTSTGVHRLK